MDSYNMYLYNERMSLGLSENKFAKKLGIGYIKYHLIENGYLKPNNKEVEKISSALNVDYSEYLYGERSYPAQKEHKRKYLVKIYDFIGSLFFKIFTAFLSVLLIAACAFSIYIYSLATSNRRQLFSESYQSFHDTFLENSSFSFSVTGSLTRPEIYRVEENKYVSLKGEYNSDEIGVLNFKTVYWTDEYRCVINVIWLDSNEYIYIANITDYETNKETNVPISTDNKSYVIGTQKSKYDEDVMQYAKAFFSDFDTLIADKLSLNVSSKDIFEESQSILSYTSTLTTISRIGIIVFAILGLIMLFGLFFSFAYGTKHGVERKLSHGLILRHSGTTLPKTDLRFTPIIPETVFEIIGIILVAIASLRIQIYISFALSSSGMGLSLADVRHMYDPFMMCFYTGMFLLYFIDFDLYMEDKRVIRNIVLYFFTFIGVYVLEVSLLESINNQTLLFSVIKNRLPNMFGTISMYFLIMYFLYFTPKFVNTKKKVIVFRLLSLIPLMIIIFTYIIFHGANTSFGWNLPNWAYYLFASERITFSLLCVSYLYGIYFLRLFFKYKYGDDMATNYFNGNRFLFAKNTLVCVIIIVISVIDLLVARIPNAKSWGFGYTYYTLLLIPLLFFYHPHKGPRNKIVDYITLALYIIAFSGVLSLFIIIV